MVDALQSPLVELHLEAVPPPDSDGDGVIDVNDACPDTALDEVVGPDGCSIDQACPCDAAWSNHGAYVRCVSHEVTDFRTLGLITRDAGGHIVSAAARSTCGQGSAG